ncbi:MAG TPA: hypothetical protein DEF39_12965 [Hungateiclostridium thermocellum]|jgi:RNase P subunit RPR2|uniref:Uncharacterized protein n=2 Tax=Acetivibrio thermocellus TaxID=1515 RepID=G2JC97_ACET2|nr:hypothetical protein [Acetivibrio thermocellus]CDG36002.1 hypothetical protein CTHBC1_1359 [Acetivibrio thermocellus BC1]ADU73994.1 hypothetical protein Clo1313_0926 [Acetivibrio thermocellus DSM 1313]AEO12419.1 hypothetical protein Cthe_3350 [Acetivibrio thermocellus ATCC 27405]ALX07932.1 hypothetical protein AD2_00937 [Acetivibrio thermocellus AD2]ANV75678.1 hypothetical protein LQRI_0937 [Acetivibrio thermocellus DSM 2360]
MYNFKTLTCYNCKSVMLNLPEVEISKLNGLNFICDCCGHQNLLTKNKFSKSINNNDPYLNIMSVDSMIL